MRRILLFAFTVAWAFALAHGDAWINQTWREKGPRIVSCFQGPAAVVSSASPPISDLTAEDDVTPRLPAVITAVAGEPFILYTDGLVLARDINAYQISIEASGMKGEIGPRFWSITPRPEDIGDHSLTITVSDWNDRQLSRTKSTLRVIPDQLPAPEPGQNPLSLLIVGDSLTHQSMMPNMLYVKLSVVTKGNLRFVGTHHPVPDFSFYVPPLPEVSHEGYGGWTWQRFLDHYKPDEASLYHAPRSPFVFFENGAPTLDVPRYLTERELPSPLDVVIFQLGVDDSFGFDPTRPDLWKSQNEAVLASADKLIAAFHQASPTTHILVMLPSYFTASTAVFQRKYGQYGPALADPWRLRRVIRALATAMIAHFDGQYDYLTLIPSHATMDVIDGYNAVDPGHPNEKGNGELASTIYATLLGVLQKASPQGLSVPPPSSATNAAPPSPADASSPAIASAAELSEAIDALHAVGGMVLPPTLYLVAGDTLKLYFNDFVPVRDPETFAYIVQSDASFAHTERRFIELSPPDNAQGSHQLTIRARVPKGATVAEATVKLIVVPRAAGRGEKHSILLVGDSLGDHSRFPNALYAMLGRPLNPGFDFLGTHFPAGSLVHAEHYGGWTFQAFLSNYNLDPAIYHAAHSPFVFPPTEPGGKPVFDVKRYISERLGGRHPDYVHIQLGINDAFLLKPDDPALDQKLDAILANADTLIAGIRAALPHAILSVGTVIPGNGADRAYAESYAPWPPLQTEWRWRQVQIRLAKRMMDHFSGKEKEGLFMVPTHVSLDTIGGYSAHSFIPSGVDYDISNAVHPTVIGDQEVAEPIYAFLKAHLAGLVDDSR